MLILKTIMSPVLGSPTPGLGMRVKGGNSVIFKDKPFSTGLMNRYPELSIFVFSIQWVLFLFSLN